MRVFILVACAALAGCASTQGIAPQYINPNTYANHSCASLQQEITRIEKLAADTERTQTPLSATGVGIGITGGRHGIYPTISLGMGRPNTSHKKQTLSRLYGEHDAMVIAARNQGCSFAQNIKIYGE